MDGHLALSARGPWVPGPLLQEASEVSPLKEHIAQRGCRVKTVLTGSKNSSENSEDGVIGFSVSRTRSTAMFMTVPSGTHVHWKSLRKAFQSEERQFAKACNYAC